MKDILRKVWKFVWEEDSLASWLVNVAIAFVLIKFVLYPGLGWALGTPAPIVAVVSGSMEHEGSFDSFWSDSVCCSPSCASQLVQGSFYEKLNISRNDFRDFPFVNGFNKGDIMLLYGADDIKIGDVIVFINPQRKDPIIHRVISVSGEGESARYTTKGDRNCDIGNFEKNIPKSNIIGKAAWRVPWLGWVKILAVGLLNIIRGY